MYENLLVYLMCRPPRFGANICYIMDDDQKQTRSKLSTMYTVPDDIFKFVRALKKLKDLKSRVDGDIIIVDYCTNVPFNQKLFYIAKIFKNRKQIHLYTNNLTHLI